MSKFIDTLTILVGLGVAGYFAYKVVLPKMGGIKKAAAAAPSYSPPSSSLPPPPPPLSSSSPSEDIIEDLPTTKPSTTKSKAPSSTTSTTKSSIPSTASGGNVPATLGYKGTGQKVAISGKSDHENGTRFNCNHKFKNYLIISHIKIGKGQDALNCKTDGPNHGSCTSLPKCCWIEPNLAISSGKLDMTSEWPHPKNHNGLPCPSCKSIGSISVGQWLGWAQALYQDGAYRHIDVWADKSGTGASWTKLASETDKGQITNATLAKRPLFLEGKGLEAEIRCNNASGGDAAIKDGWVYEITPPVGSVEAEWAQSFLSFLEAPIPRRFNNSR